MLEYIQSNSDLIPEMIKNIVATVVIVGAMYFIFGIDDDNDDTNLT